MQIVWLPKAVQNLKNIREYIEEKNPKSAGEVAKKIQKTISLLEEYPNLGKPSMVEGFREIQVPKLPFLIPYKVMDNVTVANQI